MDQGSKDMNRERDYSQIATSRQAGTRADSSGKRPFLTGVLPRLRSLFIDGQRAHARLWLPVQATAGGVPVLARLTAQPPASDFNDLQPREGDLVPFSFRLLSAAYLGAGGYHLDFSAGDVLEQALALFLEPEAAGSARQSPLVVVRDHSFAIENRIGLVHSARWSPADPAQGLVHPGIDAELHINWKLAGDVVRRLLHDPPLLDACSVSLGFGWEKSHPALENGQFWSRLGEELDGSTVRVVVTEILSVEHVGLVFAGADQTARRQDSAGPDSEGAAMTASLSSEQMAPVTKEEGDPEMEEKAITLLPESPVWALLGVEQPDLRLLEQRAGELKALADLGREALEELRREVETLIVQLDGAVESEPSQGLLKVVQATDMATLRALKDEYARRLEALMPARCQVCGSEQVSRRSSQEASLAGSCRGKDEPGLYR